MPGLDLRGPGIDDGSRNVTKVRCVAGGQRGVPGDDDARNHGVAQIADSAGLLSRSHKACRRSGSFFVKTGDSAVDFSEDQLENLGQPGSSFASRHDLQPELNLENRDGGCPD